MGMFKVSNMEQEGDFVRLKCIKVGSKLRVRIVSSGYALQANCRFPRAIRVEGKEWEVPAANVTIKGTANGHYYIVNVKGMREAQDDRVGPSAKPDKVFDMVENNECGICMSEKSNAEIAVIVPCGHRIACFVCLKSCVTCPVCRGKLVKLIRSDELE